jgi:hypothetical protein
LGYQPGADFHLTTYDEALAYLQKLDAASPHLQLVNVGKTTRGADWYVALISSPANLQNFARYKGIAQRLAAVRGLDDNAARQLAREGKAIVHIDGGLHSTEVAGQEHTLQLAYHLVSRPDDPEVKRILDEVILVLWFSLNPDGQNMVAKWYRRNLGTPYEVAPMIELYQDYVGHDNNRDGYMNNMIESRVVTKAMLDFAPQVMYNHHQTAPFPARIWIPPFAEPISTNTHPLMWRWVYVFGMSMAAYLEQHDMPGAMHRGRFDDWYPGFIDHVNSFRNTVSFLTETALYRYATPRYYTIDEFPREKQDLRPESFYQSPWKGGWWRLADAVRYMHGASMSVLVTAAKNREELLFNRYQAGRDTIAKFTKDGPFAYVIPSEQRDLPTAGVLVEKLLLNGLEVHELTQTWKANGLEYQAGSWVVLLDQPFATLVKELFEAQKYPELAEGPYDVTGWTLPWQMGVDTHAVTQPVDAAARAAMKRVTEAPKVNAPLARTQNAMYRAVNEALTSNASIPNRDKLGPLPAKLPRIAVYRPWAASIDEGWTRWILEQFKFPYTSLYNAGVQAGRLNERFDVIVLADLSTRAIMDGFQPGTTWAQYAGGIGNEGLDRLREFINNGGTLVTLNNSSRFAIEKLNLPVTDVLARATPAEFNCPGALLRIQVKESASPLVAGLPAEPLVMFERGPAFDTAANFKGRIIASYPSNITPLVSGYLKGAEKIQGKHALLEVELGKGRVILLGFRPQWRGQSHGAYKFLFNALYAAAMPAVPAPAAPKPDRFATLAAQVKTDAEKLVAANRAFFAAKGAKALDEGKKLDALLDAFTKERIAAVDAFKDQADDRAVARKVAEYAQQLRKMAADAKTQDWTDVKDALDRYRLPALEREIAAPAKN